MRLARHGAAPLLLVTLVLVAFAGVLSPDEGLYFRDHSLQFRLRGAQVREHLLEGRLPALTRADDGGHPLENQLNGTYLPFTLILLVGDFDVSYDWFVIAHYVVLVLGALGLARHLGLARPEAALAASLAGLAGPLLSLENLQGALHGLAIMPWTWWALLRLFEAPSPRRAAAFALALGFEYQGTEPVLMCLDLGFGVLALVWLRPRAVALGWCAAGVLLGFGLAAVELLPVLDNLPHTPRGRGFDYTMASAWPLRPELFIEFLAPSFWGPPDYPFIQFPSINGVNGHPYLNTLYFGSALPLAAAALANPRRRRLALGLCGGVFVLLLIAGGAATPLHRLVSSLPILSSSRFPIKYVIVASPLIIALVVLGLEATREDPRWALGATALLCAVLALGLWTVSLPEWREFLAAGLADYRDTRRVAGIDHADFPAVALEAMRARVVHALLFALALGAALTAGLGASSSSGTGAGKRPGRERAILFVVVLVGLDLATAARFSVVGASLPPSRDPFTDATRSDRDLVYHRGPNPALPPMAHRPGSSYFADEVRSGHARGVLPIHGRRRLSTTDANALDQAAHDEARRLLSGFAGLERDQVFALLGRAGVRWLSSPAVEPLERVATQRIEGEADQHLYLLPRTRPYVSSFGDWRAVSLEQTPFDEVRSRLASPEGWEVAAVLRAERIPNPNPACPPGETTLLPESLIPELLEIEHRGACPMLVVAREPMARRWRVEVDGRPAELVTAELGHLAVFVPEGRHRVRFVYDAMSARVWPISVASLLVIAALALIRRR